MDPYSLEADALGDDYLDEGMGHHAKRGRPSSSSLDPMNVLEGLGFSQGDMPEGLEDEDDDESE